MFGPTVDPTEAATFKSVAAVTEPTGSVAPTATPAADANFVDPGLWRNVDTVGNPATPISAGMPTTVTDFYKTFYGNVDPQGAAYWQAKFGGNKIDPQQASIMINEVSKNNPNINTGMTVENAFKTYLGGNTDQAGINFWKQQFGNGPINVGQLAQLTNTQSGINTDSGGGGLFGTGIGPNLSVSDAAKLAALYYGGTALAGTLGAGAAGAGAAADASFIAADASQLAAQGLSQAAIEQNLVASGVDSFLAADAAQLALQGIGPDQMTGLLTQSAGGTSMFAPTAAGAASVGGLTTGTPAATTTGAGTGLTSGLTGSQVANLAKAGLTAAGLLGGTKAISGLTGGGTGTLTGLPTQDRSGVSSGSAQYSPEYYAAIQAKYNQMMPQQQPRDVTTELKNWYETKYAPSVTTTPKVA
jgi:hypothetical protein